MSWDPVWEKVFNAQAWGKYPAVDVIRFIARNFYSVPVRKDLRLLEVGCGPGANLWYMAREGFSVYGIDGSETAIEIAKKRLNAECAGWGGELRCGDITNLPYPDNTFDGVLDVEAIYSNSIENSKRIYEELFRVTKPGGKMLSITFAPKTWGDGTGERVGHNAWIVSEGPMTGKGFVRFTEKDEIEGLVNGFKVENLELVTRTTNTLKNEIREWIIEAVKR